MEMDFTLILREKNGHNLVLLLNALFLILSTAYVSISPSKIVKNKQIDKFSFWEGGCFPKS